jgi:hypothetical protein
MATEKGKRIWPHARDTLAWEHVCGWREVWGTNGLEITIDRYGKLGAGGMMTLCVVACLMFGAFAGGCVALFPERWFSHSNPVMVGTGVGALIAALFVWVAVPSAARLRFVNVVVDREKIEERSEGKASLYKTAAIQNIRVQEDVPTGVEGNISYSVVCSTDKETEVTLFGGGPLQREVCEYRAERFRHAVTIFQSQANAYRSPPAAEISEPFDERTPFP